MMQYCEKLHMLEKIGFKIPNKLNHCGEYKNGTVVLYLEESLAPLCFTAA